MTSLRPLVAAALCAGLVSLSQAAQITVGASGVFDNSVTNSFLSAPGATWSMQFTMEAEPQPFVDPSLTEVGFFVTSPFISFSYTLNGVAISEQPLYISLYNAGNGGGIDVFFNDVFNPNQPTTALSFYGPQIYSGSELDPTLVPGVYNTFNPGQDSFWLYVDGTEYKQGDTQIVVTAVPVPATWHLALLGLAAAMTRAGRSSSPTIARQRLRNG